ncbi:PREDICTED: UPF0725 protein At4g29550-like isoform X2 [Brassica oleracea var. oleracea]|uniref:UPF0725 protein At4g29550-like isoform X2 n=1 Tax=Brassica oleracea var. oleracea TaxID=109376 RepID=UPI0006A6D831|nr:PREDICTED: UPF0725 protein At4g29550-like isoform X2 [Brassica oleracea var. oleracea]
MAKRVRTCEECVRRSIPLFIGLTNRQLAFGFDVNYNKQRPPRLVLVPCTWSKNYVIGLYGRIGLQCYNLQKTQFSDAGRRISLGTRITWFTIASRIKQIPNEPVDDEWEEEDTPGIHELYKGPIPKWFSDEARERDSKKYYVVPESELHDNDWLQLLMEVAFFSKADRRLDAYLPLELNSVVVETLEDYTTEPSEKLKADNAIFYISYKCCSDPSTPLAGDHRAVVRKTMDGKPGHMCLEVALTKEQE